MRKLHFKIHISTKWIPTSILALGRLENTNYTFFTLIFQFRWTTNDSTLFLFIYFIFVVNILTEQPISGFLCQGWLSRRGVGCLWQIKIWLFQWIFWEGLRGAEVNERQMRVVPTQLFSQSRSKARRTGRSTGNLRWVLPLFAVARRPAEGWKCLQWGTTSKPFPK